MTMWVFSPRSCCPKLLVSAAALKHFFFGNVFSVEICRSAYHFCAQKTADFKNSLSLVVDGCDFSKIGIHSMSLTNLLLRVGN
jgi:hypothetical protein